MNVDTEDPAIIVPDLTTQDSDILGPPGKAEAGKAGYVSFAAELAGEVSPHYFASATGTAKIDARPQIFELLICFRGMYEPSRARSARCSKVCAR